MRRVVICMVLAASACADSNLNNAEKLVPAISPTSSLTEVADFAADLSKAYVVAARRTTVTQDINALIIFAAAGKFVHGAVTDASDAVLAETAIAGALAQQTGVRIAPKKAIQGIYTGAKRLNCIATVARVGSLTLVGENSNTRLAASAIAIGAIEEVKITTRESIIREVPDYDKLVTDITPPGLSDEVTISGPANVSKLATFQSELNKCLGEKE